MKLYDINFSPSKNDGDFYIPKYFSYICSNMDFKFLTNNEVKVPSPYLISEGAIAHALSIGREAYLNGNAVEDNPYYTPELFEAFNEGWDLEYSYDRLNQLNRQFYSQNNGL